jgi:uncharacterized protein (DUF305 family)
MAMRSHVTAPADVALVASMATMNQKMSAAKLDGNADHDLVAMMIPHHEGAIGMCRVELRYGKDPRVLALCRGIIAAQQHEIVAMQHWRL